VHPVTGMRSQVDEAVEVVASPRAGCNAVELSHALVQFPGVRELTLFNVSGSTSLQPLVTASLPGLKRLTLREVGARMLAPPPR
jgi:hypothetical protein